MAFFKHLHQAAGKRSRSSWFTCCFFVFQRQDYEASQQADSNNAAFSAAESEIQEQTILGQTEVQYNSANSETTIGNITEDKTTDSELTSVEPSKESYTVTDMQNRILYSTTAVSEEQLNHSKKSESHNPIIDTEASLISVMDESEPSESLMCEAKLSDESENYYKHANVGNEIMQSPLLQEAQKIYDMVKDLNKKINQTQNQEKDCSKKLFVEKSEVCSLSSVNDNHIDVANVTDAGIQTSQTLYDNDSNVNKLCYDTSSPTKDVMIQTSPTSITSKNSELSEILSSENVEVCQNSVSVLSSQSSLSETNSSQTSVSDGNLSTEMETDQSDTSDAKTIVIEVFSDSTNQHLIANELSNYSCDRSQTGKSLLLLDQTIDDNCDNLETESRGISDSEMEISVTEGDHEVEVHNKIENNRSEESTICLVSEELEQKEIDSANNVEDIGSIEQRHKPIKDLVIKGTSGFVDSKNNSATESSAGSKCAVYETCEFEEVCKFEQEVETGEKHFEQETYLPNTSNSPMESDYIEESIESTPVFGKRKESTPKRDSQYAFEQEMLRDENIHSSANDENVLSEKSLHSQSGNVKAAVDFNNIVSLPGSQINGTSSTKDIGSFSVSETEFPDICSKTAAVKTSVGMEIDIKESGTEHTELNFERVTDNHKKKQDSSLDTYQHNSVHSQGENGKEELKECEIVLTGTNSGKCSKLSTVEEEYIFKSPEKGFISQEKNSVDTSENDSTCQEISFCIDSENDFNLTTGLEVIAISLLSKDETESDKHISKSKETKKPFLQDSYAMSIENQDEPYLLDKDDNSSYKDNRVDHMELEGKDELLMEESNMNEVSVKLKLNEEKATNRKRKHAGICQDVDNNFELPIKKLTIIQTTGIGKGESFAEYADTKDKKTQLKRGLSNFFQFRDKYNKLKAISPRKIRKQNVGKIVKHFFSSWFHTKQSYNLLKPESNVFMPNIETAVEGKCIRLECDETSANETKVMEDISMESEDKIAQVVSESAEEKWKQKMECEILCLSQTAKSVDDNVSSPHSASLIESENVSDLDQAEPKVELLDSSSNLSIKDKPAIEIDSSQNSDVTLGNVTCVVKSSDVSIIDNSVCYSDSETDLGYEFLLKRAAETCVEDLKYKTFSPDPASDIEMQDDHNSFHPETISINNKTMDYEQTASPVFIGNKCGINASTCYNDQIKVCSNIETEESNVCDASCVIKPDKLNLSGFITQDAIQTEMFEDTSLLKVNTQEAVAEDEENNGNGDKAVVCRRDERDGKNKDVDDKKNKDVDDEMNNDVDDEMNNDVDDEMNNDVDDEMKNDVDEEMKNDVDEDDKKNNAVDKEDEKNNDVDEEDDRDDKKDIDASDKNIEGIDTGNDNSEEVDENMKVIDWDENDMMVIEVDDETSKDIDISDNKDKVIGNSDDHSEECDVDANHKDSDGDDKVIDCDDASEEFDFDENNIDNDDRDDKKEIDDSVKKSEGIDTCNLNIEDFKVESMKDIDRDEHDKMVIEVDDETSEDIDITDYKNKGIENSDDLSKECDVGDNDKDNDGDDKVIDCDDTSEEFDVDQNNIDNDDRDDKKEIDDSVKNSEVIDTCNLNIEDFKVESMKDIDRDEDENDKKVIKVNDETSGGINNSDDNNKDIDNSEETSEDISDNTNKDIDNSEEISEDINISDNNYKGIESEETSEDIDNSDDNSEEYGVDESDKDNDVDDDEEDKVIDCDDADDTSDDFDFDDNDKDNDGDKEDEDFDDSNYDTKSSDQNYDNERREEAANDKKFQEKRKPLENQDDDTEDSISDCAALGKVTLEEDSAEESSIKNKQDSVEASVEDRKTMPSMLAVEQLSCRFSDTDDDDDEFVSPVIDYSHLDSDSGDDLQCGQLDNTKHGSENVHKDSMELEKVESDMSDSSPEVDLQFQDNEAHHIDDDSDWNESDNQGVLIETEESSIESCLDHEETGLEEESYQNRNCDKQSSSNIDNYTEIRVRTPGKRKCSFEEIMSPKLAKYDNKGEVLSETLCTSPSTNDKASFKTPKSKLKENQKNLCESPGDFCSTQMLCSSQQPDLNDITLSQVPVVTKQLEIKSIDKSRSAAMRSKARAILARLKAKKEQVLQQSSTTEDNDIVTSSQEDVQSRQTERTEAQVSMIKDEQNLQRFVHYLLARQQMDHIEVSSVFLSINENCQDCS